MDPINIPARFEVFSFTRSWDNGGGTQKISAVPGYAHAAFPKIFNGLLFGWTLLMYLLNLQSVALPVPEITATTVANFQSRKGWGYGVGNGTVRKSVGEFLGYMPSIVTFHLSLRISEMLPLLCSSTPLFPTPSLVSPKFPHVPLGVGGWPLGYEERRCCANCPFT